MIKIHHEREDRAARVALAAATMRRGVVRAGLAATLRACGTMTLPPSRAASAVHVAIASALTAHDILYRYRYYIARGVCVDFWTSTHRIGIIAKRGRPSVDVMRRRVAQCCASSEIHGLIVLTDHVLSQSLVVEGKPVEYRSFQSLVGDGNA